MPSVPPDVPVLLPFTNVFPGWVGYWGTNQFNPSDLVLYNSLSGGAPEPCLITPSTQSLGSYVIAGNYSAVLCAGEGTFGFTSAALAQSSLVPVGAMSLRFRALPLAGGINDLLVTLNGQAVPFYALFSGSNYVTYAADVSAFAGQTEELRFTERPLDYRFATLTLDSIEFSDLPIPEPGVFGLSALGALVLGWRVLRR